jgi:LPS-assembly protein
MKNKIVSFFLILVFFVSYNNQVNSNEFTFESKSIEIKNNGNIVEAKNGVKIISNNKIEITADESFYDKLTLKLLLKGNIELIDTERGLKILSEEAIYDKSSEKFLSKGDVTAYFANNYTLRTKNLEYSKKDKIIQSKFKTTLIDKFENKIITTNFTYSDIDKIFRSDNTEMTDENKNSYFFKKSIFSLDKETILAKDVEIYFAKNTFNNTNNDPRLKGSTLSFNKEETIVKNGIFTTCKINDTCPPWSLKSSEIRHDKVKKTINYQEAVLMLYDKPIFYFPRFFHPDPTVKRQSGFLMPTMISSNAGKNSVKLPYFKVLAENKDLTYSPRFYSNKDVLNQVEFRQIEENYENNIDFSLKKTGDTYKKSHFFSNSIIDLNLDGFDSSNLEISLQKTTNDTYLKSDRIKMSQNFNPSLLNSFLNFTASAKDLDISIDFEAYEDLSIEKDSDKYEYVYPSFSISKTLDTSFNEYGSFNYQASGFQKKNNTNVSETSFRNDINFLSKPFFTKFGFKNNFNLLFKNANNNSKNSSTYKDEFSSNFYSSLILNSYLPLKKSSTNYESELKPKLSLRLSPRRSENLINKNRRINIVNIFSNNRLGLTDSLEGGQSLTVGTEYNLNKKNGSEIFNMSLAQIYRDINEERLPTTSKMITKSSDIVGAIKFTPNNYVNFDYDFSLDNNLKTSNYNMAKSTISVNNFITSFEFLEESNEIGRESYLSNETSYAFSNNNKLLYRERTNRKTDLKEFYNLVYQYENDCLVAAIEYNKEYYSDRGLKPTEELFFSLTIVPFGNVGSPKISK